MRSWQKTLLAATALCALTGTVALADKGGIPNSNSGNSRGGAVPLAGAGLPILVIAGGYALLRRRRDAKAERPQITQREW